jgi:DivIVA domain-containing protein
MKLTPLDIRKQEFEKSLRGYDTSEVRNFLDIVATQWEEIADERRRLEDKVSDLKNKLEHYERVEEALQEALQTARENAEDKIKNAEREAEIIVSEAKAEAREIRQEAKAERDQLQRRTQRIDDRRGEIVARLRSFLMAEMELLARFEGDDPIGFIKLLPTEERKKLREAGVDLEQISPHFEEVGESETETDDADAGDAAALDEELFGEEQAAPPADDADEQRMTPEEEDELSAFFDEFAASDEPTEPAEPDEPRSFAEPTVEPPPAESQADDHTVPEASEEAERWEEDAGTEGEDKDEAFSTPAADDPFAHVPTDESDSEDEPRPEVESTGDPSAFAPPESSDDPSVADEETPPPPASEGWGAPSYDEPTEEPPAHEDEPIHEQSTEAEPVDEFVEREYDEPTAGSFAAGASGTDESPDEPADEEPSISNEADERFTDEADIGEEPSSPKPYTSFSEPAFSEPATPEEEEHEGTWFGEGEPSSEPAEAGGDEPYAEPQPEQETGDADKEPAAPSEPRRDFRVNSIFSADEAGAPPTGGETSPPEHGESSSEPPAAEKPEAPEEPRSDQDSSNRPTSSEEIERIRRILKNME